MKPSTYAILHTSSCTAKLCTTLSALYVTRASAGHTRPLNARLISRPTLRLGTTLGHQPKYNESVKSHRKPLSKQANPSCVIVAAPPKPAVSAARVTNPSATNTCQQQQHPTRTPRIDNQTNPHTHTRRQRARSEHTDPADMPAAQSAEFKKAAEDSRKLKAKPTDDELLQVNPRPRPGKQGQRAKAKRASSMADLLHHSSTPTSSRARRTRRSRRPTSPARLT